ncbi:outer membrane protein assembly factor BamD [Rhodomicrobium vannielii ATCC 17100]|uniref:outer membrane protein assembly factor BamD n=1 Tax=Rhodomicrobium vannielii TaxID=1069 RepID=UPI00191A8754|nr:outer membrane protein assembly factor BamD [Rhodomicrobium vannielii]MBJ7535737.1 outer membrane protein assembly factor BamD [Rhodomicrobium vannielii ATCC 17100]
MGLRSIGQTLAAVILATTLSSSLGGCGSMGSMFSSSDSTQLDQRPPDQIYKEADDLLGQGKNNKAAELFERIDQLYPYSEEAKKSTLMAAYAYQKAGKGPEAVAAARRFLALHPGSKEAALAQEIIASSYFERISGPTRDQGETKKAIAELETLISRYPDSRYSEDAKRRIKLARDTLAASEMNVGRYWQKKGNYLGAVNRFKTVVTEYQQTTHVEEALMRLTECYMALGIVNEAQTAAAVLGHNFPDSPWYKDAYALLQSGGTAPREDSGSWISHAWKRTVGSVAG